MFFSLFFACMVYSCGLLVTIFHWHGGFPRLTLDFPSHAISYIYMVLWVYFFVFSLVLMFPLTWVELVVLEPWLENKFGAFSGFSY